MTRRDCLILRRKILAGFVLFCWLPAVAWPQSGYTRTAITDVQGIFPAQAMPVGVYSVEATNDGNDRAVIDGRVAGRNSRRRPSAFNLTRAANRRCGPRQVQLGVRFSW